jgi:hypothetical protein
MGNLPSLYPKIHGLDADAQVCRRVPNSQGDLFLSECDIRRLIVARIGSGEMLSHAFLYGMLSIPQNELPCRCCLGSDSRVSGPASGALSFVRLLVPQAPKEGNGEQNQVDMWQALRLPNDRALGSFVS